METVEKTRKRSRNPQTEGVPTEADAVRRGWMGLLVNRKEKTYRRIKDMEAGSYLQSDGSIGSGSLLERGSSWDQY